MKKNLLTKLMAVLMIAVLLVSITACGNKEDEVTADQLAQLQQENAALQAQVNELTNQLAMLKQKASLETWTMDVIPWAGNTGANVTISAIPKAHVDGQSATISVQLNGLEAESVPCAWDGTAYTATVELNAADGYSYYCILTSLDGSQEQIALNTPENPTEESLIYLASYLNAYANMIVDGDGWKADKKKLTISSGYIQVQMPQLTMGTDAVTVDKAELVLKLSGEEVERQSITLPKGEGEGSYELAITDVSFSMPKMDDDHQLDLWLEVVLSDGQTLSTCGGSWYYSNGDLVLAVG